MSTSALRTEILMKCPLQFKKQLTDWINKVEGRLAEAYWYLDEEVIGEEYAQEAKKQLNQLLDELY